MEQNNVQEINLLDLLWEILYHWRMLLLAALLGCVLLLGYKVYKNVSYNKEIQGNITSQEATSEGSNNDAQVAGEQGENSLAFMTEKEMQAAIEKSETYQTLTPSEAKRVVSALTYTRKIQEKEAYKKDSIYMQLNPYHEQVCVLDYFVTVKKKDGDLRAKNLVSAYLQSVENNTISGFMKQGNPSKFKDAYNELITAKYFDAASADSSAEELAVLMKVASLESQNSVAMFSVYIAGRDEKEIQEIKTMFVDAMDEYANRLSGTMGAHTLELKDSYITEIVDSDLMDRQDSFDEQIIGYRNTLADLQANFSEGQAAAYEEISGESANKSVMESENFIYSDADKISTRADLAKYAVLGFVVGIFGYMMIYAIWYMLNGNLKSEDDLKNGFGYYILADFSKFKTKYNMKAGSTNGIDEWLLNLRLGGRTTLMEEEAILPANAKVTLRKADVDKVYFTSTVTLNDEEKERVEDLMNSLKEEGVQATFGASILKDAASLEKMTDVGSVIFVEKVGVSRMESLYKVKTVAKAQGVLTLGAIVL